MPDLQPFFLHNISPLLSSPAMQKVYEKVKAVAPTRTTTLLTGETGTGKGVVARMIHSLSSRSTGRFVSIHCGAIPDSLLESELFGHEKGSFTGAVRQKPGKFEIADGGTLFLDEIETISSSMQIKLLQVLQERTFTRVGAEKEVTTDVRIIAATNEDLHSRCKAGTFRMDLFYRLNVFPIEIPVLKDRLEDITVLAEDILARVNRTRTPAIASIHPEVLEAFKTYDWPGNIREMENLMERACILETSSVLTPESFPPDIFEKADRGTRIHLDSEMTLDEARKKAQNVVEKSYLERVLKAHDGRIKPAASAADITVRQLHNLMVKHKLKKENYRKGELSPKKQEILIPNIGNR